MSKNKDDVASIMRAKQAAGKWRHLCWTKTLTNQCNNPADAKKTEPEKK